MYYEQDLAIITILNVNERPTLTKRLITIPENTIANINIGAAMPGFDVDDTHTALIRYSLVDDKFGMFDINSITGQISTTKCSALCRQFWKIIHILKCNKDGCFIP